MEFIEKHLLGIIAFSILTMVLVVIGVVRNIAFHKEHKKHISLAESLGLKLGYINAENYQIYGQYRGYLAHIKAISLGLSSQKKMEWATQISIPMVNPNRRAIRIVKASEKYPAISASGLIPKPLVVKHQISDWIDITTNNMMFSHLILTDEVKMDLVVILKKVPAGMVYLAEEELVFMLPGLIGENNPLSLYKESLDVLCNMKESLR